MLCLFAKDSLQWLDNWETSLHINFKVAFITIDILTDSNVELKTGLQLTSSVCFSHKIYGDFQSLPLLDGLSEIDDSFKNTFVISKLMGTFFLFKMSHNSTIRIIRWGGRALKFNIGLIRKQL